MSSHHEPTEKTRAELAGCPDCNTAARKIPEKNGEYDFSEADQVRVCQTDEGVFVHYRGVGE